MTDDTRYQEGVGFENFPQVMPKITEKLKSQNKYTKNQEKVSENKQRG